MSLNQLREVVREQRGWFLDSARVLGEHVRPTKRPPEVISSTSAITQMARIANRHGVPLLVCFGPLPKGKTDVLRLNEWARKVEKDGHSPNLSMSHPALLELANSCFSDEYHCNLHGAEQFTRFVAGEAVALCRAMQMGLQPRAFGELSITQTLSEAEAGVGIGAASDAVPEAHISGR